jgi:hypothetical protein
MTTKFDFLSSGQKKAILGFVVFVAIVLGVVFDVAGTALQFGRWLRGIFDDTIEAKSMSGDDASGFLAGTPIRFSLKGASPDTVFWIFEEKDVQLGNVQNDHAFPFDSKTDTGLSPNAG